jgi:hypothetical protein
MLNQRRAGQSVCTVPDDLRAGGQFVFTRFEALLTRRTGGSGPRVDLRFMG